MANADCVAVRRAIETHNFVGWHGLFAACSAQDLFDGIPDDLSDRPARLLGDEFRPGVFVLLTLPGYYRPMATFQNGQLVLFDGMNPELAGDEALLRKDLGNPEAQLDWYYGTLEMRSGEWVYPERGITLFYSMETGKALHVALYQPTTLADYRRGLRPNLRKTPTPIKTPPDLLK